MMQTMEFTFTACKQFTVHTKQHVILTQQVMAHQIHLENGHGNGRGERHDPCCWIYDLM